MAQIQKENIMTESLKKFKESNFDWKKSRKIEYQLLTRIQC